MKTPALSNSAKLLIAIALDILDFTLGRFIGFGSVFDIILAGVAVIFWGPMGLAQLWEVFDPTDQIDGFVPTLTIIALSQMGRGKGKSEAPHDS